MRSPCQRPKIQVTLILSTGDLGARVREGRFREDLLARIDLWTFTLPGLSQRPEDIESNVDYELEGLWNDTPEGSTLEGLLDPSTLDLFDSLQLESIVTICRRSGSLSDAGRKLYAVSQQKRRSKNDADRLRQYLARFDWNWDLIVAGDRR